MASNDYGILLLCDIALALIFAAATASNCLVLLVFYRRPGLRKLSNRFVINLLATNLLSCWALLPLVALAPAVLGAIEENRLYCAVCRGMSTGICSASILAVLLIGLDQYLAIVDPLHYHARIDNTRSIVLLISSWAFSSVVGALGALFGSDIAWDRSENDLFTSELYMSLYGVCYFIVVFLTPFSILCWMYLSIYSAAHENSQRTRRNGSSAGFYNGNMAPDYMIVPTSVRSGPADPPKPPSDSPLDAAALAKPISRCQTKCSLRSTSSFIVDSLRYRISNASLFKYNREETRAARISALVIVMGLVCWFPFSMVVLLGSPLFGQPVTLLWGKLSLTLLTSSSIVSTLLFAHRNRRIQRDLRKILGMTRRSTNSISGLHSQRKLPTPQPSPKRATPPDYSNNALELLGSLTAPEGANEQVQIPAPDNYLDRVLVKKSGDTVLESVLQKVAGRLVFRVPQIALDVETSRSSFSSGASTCTQRSTSAASISDVAEELYLSDSI